MTLKKLIMALFASILMLGTTQSVMAAPNDKTIQDVIKSNQELIKAMNSDADAETISALLKQTKQYAKSFTITSGKADVQKTKGNQRITAARKAHRKGKKEAAKKLAEEALPYYKKAAALHIL